jgi:hypothetical protein
VKIGVHAYDWPGSDSCDVVLSIEIHEVTEDPTHPCGHTIGAQLWRSDDLPYSLPPGWYGWLLIHFPIVWISAIPSVVSWHIESVPDPGNFGWLTDNTAYGTTPCWNWLDGACTDDPRAEFYYQLSWLDGNLLFGASGRPEWNVAVDMGYFEGVAGDGMVTLNWRSLSETNNAKWIIERGGEKIAEYEGQGTKVTPTDYVYVDRSVTNGVTYTYIITAVNYQGNEDRYGPVTATPQSGGQRFVEFSYFTATASDRAVTLTWMTRSEIENRGFVLYRRVEGEEFIRINASLIPGAGTSDTPQFYSYKDREVSSGVTYDYQIEAVHITGYTWMHDVIVSATPLSSSPDESIQLFHNYPNPFITHTNIGYHIPSDKHVSLQIFNRFGQEVRTLQDKAQQAGDHTVVWDGRDSSGKNAASGVYFCRLQAGDCVKAIKIVLLK